jgi:hypothetical protein
MDQTTPGRVAKSRGFSVTGQFMSALAGGVGCFIEVLVLAECLLLLDIWKMRTKSLVELQEGTSDWVLASHWKALQK